MSLTTGRHHPQHTTSRPRGGFSLEKSMAEVHHLADHKALTCDCGSVNFSLLMSDGIECNGCSKRQPFSWREYDAHECPDCGGQGRVSRYHKVSHQLGTDSLPFWDECATCEALGWCGPDASARAAIAKPAR